jgi:hypothetical protein
MTSPSAGRPSASARPYLVSAVLLAVPVIALLAVPLYSRISPSFLGLPMFYWWTFLWIVLLALATFTSHRIIDRAKATGVAR